MSVSIDEFIHEGNKFKSFKNWKVGKLHSSGFIETDPRSTRTYTLAKVLKKLDFRIVGSSNVGKSSLFRQFVYGFYDSKTELVFVYITSLT